MAARARASTALDARPYGRGRPRSSAAVPPPKDIGGGAHSQCRGGKQTMELSKPTIAASGSILVPFAQPMACTPQLNSRRLS